MIKFKRETFKTILLTILIIASMIQMGIQWSQQVQGFLFPFIAKIFNGRDKYVAENIDILKYRYFVPENVIVSISPTTSLWKLDQNDSYFNKIWNDMKDNYFPAMIGKKPDKVISKAQWEEITDIRCIRIDFRVNWPSEIILPLESASSSDFKGFSSVKSIAVLSQADVNETVNMVYVYDGAQAYQYQVHIGDGFLPKSFYLKIADELDSQNKSRLSILSAVTNFESPSDILVSLNREETSCYSALKLDIPPSIILNMSNIDSIQDKILLDKKDTLVAEYNESAGEILFTDTENLYKLYNNGVFEYQYLPTGSKQAGTVSAAFSRAISFIELRRDLMENVDIVLTNIEKEDSYYEMHFGYRHDGVNIYYTKGSSGERISSPLIIKANAERVLDCKWAIRAITKSEKPKSYSIYFIDLINKIPYLYPEMFKREKPYFECIEPGYIFGPNNHGELISPSWIISTDLKDYFIPLLEKEG